MCGCNELTCAGGCPCGCLHTLQEHDRALRNQIALEIKEQIEHGEHSGCGVCTGLRLAILTTRGQK